MSAWASQASKEVAVVLMTAAPCQGRGGQRHHQYKAPRGELDEKCSANRLVLAASRPTLQAAPANQVLHTCRKDTINSDVAAPYSLVNSRHPRSVNAYPGHRLPPESLLSRNGR